MAHVTLVLTRTPLDEFHRGRQSGRWGTMLMVEGPKVFGAVVNGVAQSAAMAGVATLNAAAAIVRPFAQVPSAPALAAATIAGKRISLLTDGTLVAQTTEFDTMERFRSDSGNGFYMQTKPQPMKPYRLTMYVSSTVARLNTTGRCLRVHDHGYTRQGSGDPAGILVHEAPNVGWLIGCISPRVTGHKVTNSEDRSPSRQAINQIFEAMGGFSAGREASLVVLDW